MAEHTALRHKMQSSKQNPRAIKFDGGGQVVAETRFNNAENVEVWRQQAAQSVKWDWEQAMRAKEAEQEKTRHTFKGKGSVASSKMSTDNDSPSEGISEDIFGPFSGIPTMHRHCSHKQHIDQPSMRGLKTSTPPRTKITQIGFNIRKDDVEEKPDNNDYSVEESILDTKAYAPAIADRLIADSPRQYPASPVVEADSPVIPQGVASGEITVWARPSVIAKKTQDSTASNNTDGSSNGLPRTASEGWSPEPASVSPPVTREEGPAEKLLRLAHARAKSAEAAMATEMNPVYPAEEYTYMNDRHGESAQNNPFETFLDGCRSWWKQGPHQAKPVEMSESGERDFYESFAATLKMLPLAGQALPPTVTSTQLTANEVVQGAEGSSSRSFISAEYFSAASHSPTSLTERRRAETVDAPRFLPAKLDLRVESSDCLSAESRNPSSSQLTSLPLSATTSNATTVESTADVSNPASPIAGTNLNKMRMPGAFDDTSMSMSEKTASVRAGRVASIATTVSITETSDGQALRRIKEKISQRHLSRPSTAPCPPGKWLAGASLIQPGLQDLIDASDEVYDSPSRGRAGRRRPDEFGRPHTAMSRLDGNRTFLGDDQQRRIAAVLNPDDTVIPAAVVTRRKSCSAIGLQPSALPKSVGKTRYDFGSSKPLPRLPAVESAARKKRADGASRNQRPGTATSAANMVLTPLKGFATKVGSIVPSKSGRHQRLLSNASFVFAPQDLPKVGSFMLLINQEGYREITPVMTLECDVAAVDTLLLQHQRQADETDITRHGLRVYTAACLADNGHGKGYPFHYQGGLAFGERDPVLKKMIALKDPKVDFITRPVKLSVKHNGITYAEVVEDKAKGIMWRLYYLVQDRMNLDGKSVISGEKVRHIAHRHVFDLQEV